MNLGNWLKGQKQKLKLAYLATKTEHAKPDKWVFVVGCYNSGTTLLHDVVKQHPDIASLPKEGQYCTDQLLQPKSIGLARAWALQPERFQMHNSNADVARIKKQWALQMQPTGKTVYLEKSIPNAARIDWLNSNFENAYFVAIVRNGYAVAEGIRRKSTRSLDDAAQQWQNANQIMIDDLDKIPNSHLISYEDFTEHPEQTTAAVFKFLGLADCPEVSGQTQWSIHGVNSKITNMNHRSFDKLTGDDIQVIEKCASPMLERFGYLKSRA